MGQDGPAQGQLLSNNFAPRARRSGTKRSANFDLSVANPCMRCRIDNGASLRERI